MIPQRPTFQWVWWWSPRDWWPLIDFGQWTGHMRLFYRWSLCIGPLELRRWTPADEAQAMFPLLRKSREEP